VTLGERLRELRIAEPLHAAAGDGCCRRRTARVPPAEWSHIEAGRVKPTPELVWTAALALGAEAEYGELICEWVEAPQIDYSKSICNGRMPS